MRCAHDRPGRPSSSMNHAASSRLAAGTGLATLRVNAKLAALALISVPLLPLQWLLMHCTRGRGAFVLPRLWFAGLRTLMGIRVERGGCAASAHWRSPCSSAAAEIDAADVAATVAAQIRPDHDVVLFAGGITSSGERVAAFKSNLFSLFLGGDAHTRPWTLRAFTLQVLSVDGRPLAQGGERDAYAFYGTMQAGVHVMRFLGMSGAVVRLTFHAPIALDHGTDRKVMAQRLHAIVAAALPAPRSDGTPA
ncbi:MULTISPECIES: 1-acyl-sn-glycerol-3-phosphate acyltransferase [Xanthomonas translucens group]|uniref:1-acyl-sn-glycerol-3-phosphate acyltransferase n=1 Tax=Xanthomonas translucens group TaxID=3390202 RepID=UPI001E513AA2|nr:1-acyl-sn-glycerol-3-phosphate acyltransferase [Xanthomonas translucens]